jgi:hypothetical protein
MAQAEELLGCKALCHNDPIEGIQSKPVMDVERLYAYEYFTM